MYALAVLFTIQGCTGQPYARMPRLGKGQKYGVEHISSKLEQDRVTVAFTMAIVIDTRMSMVFTALSRIYAAAKNLSSSNWLWFFNMKYTARPILCASRIFPLPFPCLRSKRVRRSAIRGFRRAM